MNLKMMFSKRVHLPFLAVLVLVMSGCSAVTELSPTQNQKPIEVNSISGHEGGNGPVLVVKIDDTPEAHPQIGLEDADCVYIEQVEGGLTRLAAVFSSRIPELIGPIRSARISDIDLLAQYGKVAFAYSGAQSKLLPVIASSGMLDLGAQHESPLIYTRDATRSAPVDMVLRAQDLMEKLKSQKADIANAKEMGWEFSDEPLGGKKISSVTMNWPANSYSAIWSEQESRWLLNYHGVENVSASGLILGPTTLVIQVVSIIDSTYRDKMGGITPLSITVGSGQGFVLRDGKAFRARWIRPNAQEQTRWTLEDGNPLPFAPGQIWVALVASAPDFTYPAVSASPSATK